MALAPLNGTKTHPLSPHALFVLRCIAERPRPRQEINPGVNNRLERGGLARSIPMPSPYKKDAGKGVLIDYMAITPDGRLVLDGHPLAKKD